MSKKILSLDLGITSIGYAVVEEKQNNQYSLIDYGVSMIDSPFDKDGSTKKALHSQAISAYKLLKTKKQRLKQLAKLFAEFNFGSKNEFLAQEKQNLFKNKWGIRAKEVFKRKLSINELFTIFYHIAKHRGYKSLNSEDLLEELCEELGIETNKKTKEDDEKGQIKKALKKAEMLKQKYPNKTIASIIYEIESKKKTPTFRNHDNYNYMIRREYILDEITTIIKTQKDFGLFDKDFDVEEFISKLKQIIIEQKSSTNDLSLFGNCEYYPDKKVAHQYSLISDIFKFYQNISNITFNKNIKITKEQIELLEKDFLAKIKKGKNISDIKYKDIRKILKLSDDIKIFNKDDSYISKGKTLHHTITKFHFLKNLSKFDNSYFVKALEENDLESLAEIFEILQFEKDPKEIFEKLKDKLDNKTIIELIKNKSGKSLNISHYTMIKFIPYYKQGLNTDEIKQKLNLNRSEDYSKYKKGIKYLHIKTYEEDDNLEINNHAVKYIVSAVLRLVKHLHSTYGGFDEIKVESTRELSLNKDAKKAIEKANKEYEKQKEDILKNKEYQQIAKDYNKNLEKYIRKILMWQEQERLDIYSGKTIPLSDIFENKLDIDHIIPQSLGGLSVKHNLVLVYRDSNLQKSNNLPMNYLKDTQGFINRVEYLFENHKINWKKRKNLLATSLEETYKDTIESKPLKATSYIEALSANILKRYYPFNDKQKQIDGSAIRHIQGRATTNIRKILQIKTKSRDTNIHHTIDAILIALINHSWLQKLSNTFRENFGKNSYEEAMKNIKKQIPLLEGAESKEIINLIEKNYNIYGEDSIFYKDIFKKTKVINYWVSKKPMVSKIHKDSIYGKKENGIFTIRENIKDKFISLKLTPKTTSDEFNKKFKKEILDKLYVYKVNPKDKICGVIINRANDIKALLDSFSSFDLEDKEIQKEAKESLEALLHKDIIDINGNIVRKMKFYQTNLTGFEIRGGLAVKEKSFIGFKAWIEKDKLQYERIDIANFKIIKKQNDSSFKAYKNDIVFFIYKDKFVGGKIVSFLDEKKMAAFSNSRFPANIASQPYSFLTLFNGKPNSHKQHSVGKAIGIIKLNLDILGNIKSYQKIGKCESEILEFIKKNLRR